MIKFRLQNTRTKEVSDFNEAMINSPDEFIPYFEKRLNQNTSCTCGVCSKCKDRIRKRNMYQTAREIAHSGIIPDGLNKSMRVLVERELRVIDRQNKKADGVYVRKGITYRNNGDEELINGEWVASWQGLMKDVRDELLSEEEADAIFKSTHP